MNSSFGFTDKMLMEMAKDLRSKSYAPYSNYSVGAVCVGNSGVTYTGCNIENSSYPVGICAERVATASAIAHGETSIKTLVIAGGPRNMPVDNEIKPCGMCLQFLSEFMKPDGRILIVLSDDSISEFSLHELLPYGFILK